MATPPASKPWWRNRRRILSVAAIGLGVVAVGGAIAYQVLKRPGDIHNASVPFHRPKPQKPKVLRTNWPFFGFNPARTRYLPARGVKPPYRKIWHYVSGPLMEFPPVYANGRLYAINNSAQAFSLDANSGKLLWERKVGQLNASSPAYAHGRLYMVNLVPGQILKLNAANGKTIWRRSLPGRAESSPLVIGNVVYFGCENGQLFALNIHNGKTIWATTLGGPVKSAPAYEHGILYVGDYGGNMNAVNAHTGKLKWQTSSQGLGFGVGGEFYSTPAVAFGRVYAGNNDHRIYSFDVKDGTLAWSHSTGSYVYSGPTVSATEFAPPTVYIGSFDGYVYALNAKTGATRWQRSAGGPVIGSLSAVGRIVYVSEFDPGGTLGLDMANGHQLFHFRSGAYTPVISDGHRIYLTGYSSVNALQPFTPAPKAPKKKPASRRQSQGRPSRGKGH
jgi:outer membrane protein assembly factor BamB